MPIQAINRKVTLRQIDSPSAFARFRAMIPDKLPAGQAFSTAALQLMEQRGFPPVNQLLRDNSLAQLQLVLPLPHQQEMTLWATPKEIASLQQESPSAPFSGLNALYNNNFFLLALPSSGSETIAFFSPATLSSGPSHSKTALDQLLNNAFTTEASDVIFKVGRPVLYKVQGVITPYTNQPLTRETIDRIIAQVWGQPLPAELTDLNCSYEVDSGRLRVNVGHAISNPYISFRLIPSEIPDFSKLSLPDDILKFAGLKRGIVLVTGPVGTGKSTTLASMIKHISAQDQRVVVTIEDPVEFVHQDNSNTGSIFFQRAVGPDVISFAEGLKQALRQNPDIIMVGEMRDLETVETALNAALSGHLVLGTLHTISAIQTVDRLVSLFPETRQEDARMMLSLSLKAVISQALLPRSDGKGRIPCVEVLPIVSEDIRKFIREGTTNKIRQVAETKVKQGVYPFDGYLFKLVQDGFVSPEAALNFSQEPDSFREKLMTFGKNPLSQNEEF